MTHFFRWLAWVCLVGVALAFGRSCAPAAPAPLPHPVRIEGRLP